MVRDQVLLNNGGIKSLKDDNDKLREELDSARKEVCSHHLVGSFPPVISFYQFRIRIFER